MHRHAGRGHLDIGRELLDGTTRLGRSTANARPRSRRPRNDANSDLAADSPGLVARRVAYDALHLGLIYPATRAQLELSRDIADQIHGEGRDAVRVALTAVSHATCSGSNEARVRWPRSTMRIQRDPA
jgi:hypothetical protein